MTNPLFSFIHVTDTHLSESEDVVTPFVESVNTEKYHPRPDVIVFGGDNISASREDGTVCEREMPMFQEIVAKLQVQYYVICHNHDTWAESCRGTQYRRYFGNELDRVVELPGGFTAVCVSGMYVDGEIIVEGLLDKVSWLDDTLCELRDRKVLLFGHVPMFPPQKACSGAS
jgi:3',5'-cyclic AMP phosphodiesterase CpdA